MAKNKIKKDKHFPLFANDNPLRRLVSSPGKYCSYVKRDQTIADLGCGPGYFTFAMAETVGPRGCVYAVDSDEKAIRSVENRAAGCGYDNIDAHITSAASLDFIKDESVDFILADGLLCSMAPQDHESAVNEMKRILKPTGKAFIKVTKGFMSYIDRAEWESVLEGFNVEKRNYESIFEDRWALVSKKD